MNIIPIIHIFDVKFYFGKFSQTCQRWGNIGITLYKDTSINNFNVINKQNQKVIFGPQHTYIYTQSEKEIKKIPPGVRIRGNILHPLRKKNKKNHRIEKK